MLVRDLPDALDFPEAQGLSVPELDLVSANGGPRHQIKAVADAEIAAHGNRKIANFSADRTPPSRKPGLIRLRIRHCRDQRRRQRERDKIRREARQRRLRVFLVERVYALVDQVADTGFVGGLAVLHVHRASSLGLVMHNPRTNGAGVIRQEAIIFSASRHGAWVASARAETGLCPLRSNFRRKIARDSIHCGEWHEYV